MYNVYIHNHNVRNYTYVLMHTLYICVYCCVNIYVFITVGPLQQPPPIPMRPLRQRVTSGIAYVAMCS